MQTYIWLFRMLEKLKLDWVSFLGWVTVPSHRPTKADRKEPHIRKMKNWNENLLYISLQQHYTVVLPSRPSQEMDFQLFHSVFLVISLATFPFKTKYPSTELLLGWFSCVSKARYKGVSLYFEKTFAKCCNKYKQFTLFSCHVYWLLFSWNTVFVFVRNGMS